MTHRKKVEHLLADLSQCGIPPATIAPPLYRLLWSLGIEVPPPHFQRFGALAAMASGFFTLVFAGLIGLWQWRALDLPFGTASALSGLAGVFFGTLLAASYKSSAKLLKLPRWEQYPSPDGTRGKPRSSSLWVRSDLWVRCLFGTTAVLILMAVVIGLPSR